MIIMHEHTTSLADPRLSPACRTEAEVEIHERCAPLISKPVDQPPVRLREILALLLLVALCDVTIYRGHGFAGFATLLALAPLPLFLGTPRPAIRGATWLIAGMLLLLSARTLWLGSELGILVGLSLLVACSLTLHGRRPYVFDIVFHGLQTIAAGVLGLSDYLRSAARIAPRTSWVFWLSWALPAAALVLFGTLFILANPDLVTIVVDVAGRWLRQLGEWLAQLDAGEIIFWLAVAWFSTGLFRPMMLRLPQMLTARAEAAERQRAETAIYGALRNTLIAVSLLFAVYLVFEFRTLWFRQFPKGFYYAGYAHQGAGWLTLATVALSVIFRGSVLDDPRLPHLRRLAWIWSAENLVLALTVYNRMQIYVEFNGMTRMRTIGLFGISTVVAGFCLVLWKIIHSRDFSWLVSRQLWALAVAVYLYSLTPVDAMVHSYNVRRVLAGDLAPSVQISVHPINSEGVLVLQPLIHCRDPIIREGVRAMLAQREIEAETIASERANLGWTAYQLADALLLQRLRAHQHNWAAYRDDHIKRQAALGRFHAYAYQWY